MSNEMTNEQKAVTIITKDGWIFEPKEDMWQHEEHATSHIEWLTKLYLTDLNYLVPVAVKVYEQLSKQREIDEIIDEFDHDSTGLLSWGALHDQYSKMTKTPEGTYQPLFDAVHEAIVYLENQNA